MNNFDSTLYNNPYYGTTSFNFYEPCSEPNNKKGERYTC